jgi:hypothetical protein
MRYAFCRNALTTNAAPGRNAATPENYYFNKAAACLRAASVWPPSIRASSVTRDFLSSSVNLGNRPAIFHLLGHDVMRVRRRGHLRQMRDAQHLPLRGNLLHLFADRIGRLAADVRVHLVKNQNGNFVLGASTVFSASITRAISPDDAMARSGLAGSPGFGANWNSISSKPVCLIVAADVRRL